MLNIHFHLKRLILKNNQTIIAFNFSNKLTKIILLSVNKNRKVIRNIKGFHL